MKKPLREYLADLTEYVNVNRILRIGKRATKKAQEDNRRMGIPNVYSINGQLYYELPSGELTTEDPMTGQPSEDDGETPDAHTVGEATSPKTTQQTSTNTDTETATEKDAVKPSVTPHTSKNGAVNKPKTPATVSDPTVDTDK